MIGPVAEQLKELGALCRNIEDAAAVAAPDAALIHEIADWTRVATRIIGQMALDVAELRSATRFLEELSREAAPISWAARAPESAPPVCPDCGDTVAEAGGLCASCMGDRAAYGPVGQS